MRINQKLFLLISEAIIPVLGFFLWDWGLYFILLFYFLDMIAQEVIMYFKTKKIKSAQRLVGKENWFKYGFLSIVVLFATFFMVHIAMISIQPDINFIQQAKYFWNYEDMGVKQGYILLPLVAVAAYQQYKMSFLMRGLDRTTTLKTAWKMHTRALLIVIGFAGLALGLSQLFVVPEVAYVLGIVIIVGVYGFLFKK